MSDFVVCAECGTRHDSQTNPFCPRCGSTARGQAVPGAVAVARRNDPGRRRVQASGALLVLVGVLFLVSGLVGLSVSSGELAQRFTAPMADQPGGTLVVAGGAGPYDASVHAHDGSLVANTTAQAGDWTVESPRHATLQVAVVDGNGTTNGTVIVLAGDTLTVAPGDLGDGVLLSPALAKTVSVGRIVFLVAAAVLLAGGVAALLLRAFPAAAAAAVLGIVLALVALLANPVAGLLFALPFGFAAFFILRGRRHFVRPAT